MIEKPTPIFVRLSIFYAVALVVSNIMAGKLIVIGGFVLTAAIIVYPLVYIISDIMTEVYGMRLSMVAIQMNAVANLFLAAVSAIILILPFPEFWHNQGAFVSVFQSTPRIVIASLLGYYLGDWANSAVISRMKVLSNGKGFPLRAVASTIIGQFVDTGLFITIAFWGTMPTAVLIQMLWLQYIVKCSYETVCVPLTTVIVAWWKKLEGIDVYDNQGRLSKTYRIY